MSGLLAGRVYYTPLPAHLKLTLLALADEANDDGHGVFIGQKRLARKVGATDRTVRANLAVLREAGYIHRLPESHPRFGTDQYDLDLSKLPTERDIDEETSSATPPEEVSSPEVGRNGHRKSSVDPTGSPLPTTRELPVSKGTREIEELVRFPEFYKIYPRHEKRPDAEKAFGKALKRATAEEIISGAQRYRDDLNREDQFTAHPASWLNADCWNDDPLPVRNGKLQPSPARKAEWKPSYPEMTDAELEEASAHG